jgi:Glyoxalase superfamily protein
MRPGIEPKPWRSKLMEVIDPFNNQLRFDERPRSPQDAG